LFLSSDEGEAEKEATVKEATLKGEEVKEAAVKGESMRWPL
jgi:hypothetical protein